MAVLKQHHARLGQIEATAHEVSLIVKKSKCAELSLSCILLVIEFGGRKLFYNFQSETVMIRLISLIKLSPHIAPF